MFPSTKNTPSFWLATNSKLEKKSSHPFGSYPKPQISDLIVLAAYPFGSILSSVSKGEYRYGMNTQEKDNEIYGEGNSYSAEYWQYDARLGRRWNVDPRDVPSFSPYSCFANNPIVFIDIYGDSAVSGSPDLNLSKGNAGGVSPGGSQLLSWNSSTVFINADFGADNAGDAQYRTVGIIEEGTSFIWDENKKWYVDADGKEWKNNMFAEVTNAVGSLVTPFVSMAIDWVTEGTPMHSLKQAFDESGQKDWGTFLANSFISGMYESWSDFKAGGRNRQQLLLTMFVGFTSAGLNASVFSKTGGIMLGKNFMESAGKSWGNQGLTVAGRALQKHSGRKGSAFENVKFSHKTANQDAVSIINNIKNSPHKIIQKAENGGIVIFDKSTGMGFGISRNGAFNGFRELK